MSLNNYCVFSNSCLCVHLSAAMRAVRQFIWLTPVRNEPRAVRVPALVGPNSSIWETFPPRMVFSYRRRRLMLFIDCVVILFCFKTHSQPVSLLFAHLRNMVASLVSIRVLLPLRSRGFFTGFLFATDINVGSIFVTSRKWYHLGVGVA